MNDDAPSLFSRTIALLLQYPDGPERERASELVSVALSEALAPVQRVADAVWSLEDDEKKF